MDWVGVVYLWAADITADTRDVSVGIDFKDIIDKLEMAFQGHVEAQGDDFGGFVDLAYIAVGDHSSNSLAEFDARSRTDGHGPCVRCGARARSA